MIVDGFRIVEIKNGKILSLFHGTNSSREIRLDVWNSCDKKLVKEGSHGKLYNSGWHFFTDYETAINFFSKKFKNKDNRFIVACKTRGNIRKKWDNPRCEVFLADEILIRKEDIDVETN